MKRLQLIKEWKDSDWPFKINAGDVNSELVHKMRCFKKDLEKENCKHPVYMHAFAHHIPEFIKQLWVYLRV